MVVASGVELPVSAWDGGRGGRVCLDGTAMDRRVFFTCYLQVFGKTCVMLPMPPPPPPEISSPLLPPYNISQRIEPGTHSPVVTLIHNSSHLHLHLHHPPHCPLSTLRIQARLPSSPCNPSSDSRTLLSSQSLYHEIIGPQVGWVTARRDGWLQ